MNSQGSIRISVLILVFTVASIKTNAVHISVDARHLQPRQGTSCGSHRLRAGQYLTAQSSNFNSGTYGNREDCTWKFVGQQCVVKASCPCFDVPTSPDCKRDYLRLSDTYSFALRFCGSVTPLGFYNSTTNKINLRFKANGGSGAGSGFLCFVTCTVLGQADPIVPIVTCPTSPNNPTTTISPVPPGTGTGSGIVVPPGEGIIISPPTPSPPITVGGGGVFPAGEVIPIINPPVAP